MTGHPITKHVAGTLTLLPSPGGNEDEVTITTPTLDLMRDRVLSDGMDLEPYLSGPRAVNLAHWESPLPVAQTIALTQTPTGVRARFRWLDNVPGAAAVKSAFDEGVLGASIEFRADEARPNSEGGWDFVKSTLTGWAFTGNPANLACVKMYEALGRWGRRAGDELVLELEEDADDKLVLQLDDDKDALLSLDPQLIPFALRRIIDEAVQAALRPAGVGEELDDVDVAAVLAEALRDLPALVGAEVRKQFRQITGRID